MRNNLLLDATLDNQQTLLTQVVVPAESGGQSAIYDLKTVDPASGTLRLNWNWDDAAEGGVQVASLCGSNDPTFATDNQLLASLVLGSVSGMFIVSNVTNATYRGTGVYFLPWTNVVGANTRADGSHVTRTCRYLRLVVRTISPGSGCTFNLVFNKD